MEFATKEEALRGIAELNDTTIGDTGRLIFVREDREDRNLPREAREPRPPAPARRVYAAAPPAGGGFRREPREPREHREHVAAAPAAAAAPAGGESLKGRQVFVGNVRCLALLAPPGMTLIHFSAALSHELARS